MVKSFENILDARHTIVGDLFGCHSDSHLCVSYRGLVIGFVFVCDPVIGLISLISLDLVTFFCSLNEFDRPLKGNQFDRSVCDVWEMASDQTLVLILFQVFSLLSSLFSIVSFLSFLVFDAHKQRSDLLRHQFHSHLLMVQVVVVVLISSSLPPHPSHQIHLFVFSLEVCIWHDQRESFDQESIFNF